MMEEEDMILIGEFEEDLVRVGVLKGYGVFAIRTIDKVGKVSTIWLLENEMEKLVNILTNRRWERLKQWVTVNDAVANSQPRTEAGKQSHKVLLMVKEKMEELGKT